MGTEVELAVGIHPPSLPVLVWRNTSSSLLFSSLEQVRLLAWDL